MKQLSIQASQKRYRVSIGSGVRFRLKDFFMKDYHKIFIITDEHVARHYLEDFKQGLGDAEVYEKVIAAGEAAKDKVHYFMLLDALFEAALDRKSLVLALGGGVIGDLAGFVASTYMRGIDFIQLPTTILAHDSSVGGKVAINHHAGKNLIGSFYPPAAVVYDVDTLHTLPEKEIRSGYAEIMKEAFIQDAVFAENLLARNSILELDKEVLAEDLYQGIAIKAKIVEEDEKELGVRKFLNFGHTLAHAIEAEAGYGTITHGEAVAVGMLFAMQVSERIFGTDLPISRYREWLKQNQYPLTLPNLEIDRLIERMKMDKKSENNQIHMVLLESIGSPVTKIVDQAALKEVLTAFMKELMSV